MSMVLQFPSRGAPAEPIARRRWAHRRAIRFLATVLLPIALALAVVGPLWPSRIDGGSDGVLAWLARLGGDHPVLLGLGFFLAFSAAGGYWLARARAAGTRAMPGEAPALASLDQRLRAGFLIAGVAVVGLLARTALVDAQRVIGVSMVPTLQSGDRVLVNRLAYGLRLPFTSRRFHARAPRRGDLIVFPNVEREGPNGGMGSLVKRVVGLPGDVITFHDGSPVINGWAVPSCDAGPFVVAAGSGLVRGRLAVEVLGDRAYLTLRSPVDDPRFSRFEVPAGELFVLGDDRPASDDSRTWNESRGGGVPIANVEGRVSRLALGTSSAGRLDLRQLLAPLRPTLRPSELDVSALERRVADCLAHRPRSSEPPKPAPKETP